MGADACLWTLEDIQLNKIFIFDLFYCFEGDEGKEWKGAVVLAPIIIRRGNPALPQAQIIPSSVKLKLSTHILWYLTP